MTNQLPLKNSISIGILGCVSAGKSTLTNAVLVNKMSNTKIKRTTMLPQVYTECTKKDELTREAIDEILKTNNESNQRILNGEVELTEENCVNIYHEIPRCYDLMRIPRGTSLNIYDVPGLNDSTTESIYYNYINKTFPKLDIIFIVVDINEAFNTSSSIKILTSMVENAKRYPEKKMNICIIANKCDELTPNSNGGLDFVDEEYQEMYEQIEKETNKYLLGVNNIEFEIVKLCAEDSFIYRMYQKNPNVKLDPKLVNKFGINEFGKRTWTGLKEEDKLEKIKEFFAKENIEQSLKLTGFNDLKDYMNRTIDYQRQYDIMLSNIKLEIESIPKYTNKYEVEITNRYNHVADVYKELITIYGKKKVVKLDLGSVTEYIEKHFLENVKGIDISTILNSPTTFTDSKATISLTKKRLNDRFDTEILEEQYNQIVCSENGIILKEIERLCTLMRNEPHTHIELILLSQFRKLKENNYSYLTGVIENCHKEFSAKHTLYCVAWDIDKEDRFIDYFNTLQEEFGYSTKKSLECIKNIQLERLGVSNVVTGLFEHVLNKLDFDKYDEDFQDYLINLKIALYEPPKAFCTQGRNYKNQFNAFTKPLTKQQKENVMSLFTYMLSLYDLQSALDISTSQVEQDNESFEEVSMD